MRRFVLWFALSFALGSWIILQTPEHIPTLIRHSPLAVLLAVYGVYLGRYLHRPVIICLATGLAAGSLYTAVYNTVIVQPLETLCERTVVMDAEVRAIPERYEKDQRVEIRVSGASVGLSHRTFSAIGYLPLTDDPIMPGDEIHVLATFYQPTNRQGFDRQQYQMANGNFLSFSYLKDPENKEPVLFEVQKPAQIPFRYRPQMAAQQFGTQILSALPEREAGFLYALLLGNRNHLDPIDEQNLQKVGLSHVIAVSGLHLMFLVGLIYRLFSRRIGVFISFAAIVFFILMTGASPSIMRAGIMAVLSGIAFLFGRESDGQTSLGVALLVLLCINPYALFSLSLQLSFLSTFGILRYAAKLERILTGKIRTANAILRKALHACGAAVSCSLCAALFTTPVLVHTFGYITLLAVPANLMVLWGISLIFGIGVFFCLIPPVSAFLAQLLVPLIDYVLWCAKTLGTQNWGILYWDEPSGKIAVFAVLVLVVLILSCRHVCPKVSIPLCCLVLAGSTGYAYFTHCNTTRVTVHAVGEGQMISIADGYDTLSLIDCGSSVNQDGTQILRETMNWYGFTELDTLILTAVDKAHARNAPQILREIPIAHCIIPNHVKESGTLAAIEQAVQQSSVPLTVWEKTGESAYPIPGIAQTTLIGGIDRKLGVHLQDHSFDFLTLHSFTQNMLDDLLSTTPVKGECVVLANQFEKQDLLQRALQILQPSKILLSSGYGSLNTLFEIPVLSTNQIGDMVWKIPHF